MRVEEAGNDWEAARLFLPVGWEKQAKERGAMLRRRRFKDPGYLLRVLLVHLAGGCSLRGTVARARQARLGKLSDVALLKRLRAASDWLRWMAVELLARRNCTVTRPEWLSNYNVRCFDATVICEPGSRGTDWRLHYSLRLFGLDCDDFKLTSPEVGETFANFSVAPGDLILADRGYGSLKGLCYVRERGGDFLVRLKSKAFRLYVVGTGEEFDLLEALQGLAIGEIGDWDVEARAADKAPMKLRVCGVKKSREAAEDSAQRALRKARERGYTLDRETQELQHYVVLATSVGRASMTAEQVAELYRIRWQVEIAFKRLKTIMGLGHLPKTDPVSAQAWLHGKVFVALLTQAMVDEGRTFSPWGYEVGGNRKERKLVA